MLLKELLVLAEAMSPRKDAHTAEEEDEEAADEDEAPLTNVLTTRFVGNPVPTSLVPKTRVFVQNETMREDEAMLPMST